MVRGIDLTSEGSRFKSGHFLNLLYEVQLISGVTHLSVIVTLFY